jgi:hypothetical protein
MRARHRHFNPAHAGADLVLDARYIPQSDNTAVSTWADRSGNGYDASQATAAYQPTFQTAELGGNGVVRFDGSDDFLQGTPVAQGQAGATWLIVGKGNGGRDAFFSQGSSGVFTADVLFAINLDNTRLWQVNNGADGSYTAPSASGFVVQSIAFNGTLSGTDRLVCRINGTNTVTSTFTPPATTATGGTNFNIGTYIAAPAAWYLGGDVAVVTAIPSAPSTALRKRLEHAAAFSFKISCN